MLGQESRDRLGFRCSLDPTHRPGATWTAVEINRENVFQKPRPSLRSRRPPVVTLQQLELIASGGWRPADIQVIFAALRQGQSEAAGGSGECGLSLGKPC